jgi:diadenosine tetraphosphate (Ap4A) HIT family hydrolase
MNKSCPFCTTVPAEERTLKEGRYAYVVLSNPRLMPGHLLVIPKRHIEGRIADLTAEECSEIFQFLAEFQTKILERLASGCDIRQNFKPYVENSRTHVNHMHWHLHPRNLNDELHDKADIHRNPLYSDLPQNELDYIFDKLK